MTLRGEEKTGLWCLACGLFLFDLHTLKIRNSGCKKSCDSVSGLQVIGYSSSRHCFHASKLKPPPACERSLNFHCWTAFQTLMARQPMMRKSTRKEENTRAYLWNHQKLHEITVEVPDFGDDSWVLELWTILSVVVRPSLFILQKRTRSLRWADVADGCVPLATLFKKKTDFSLNLFGKKLHFTSLKKLSHTKM